MRINENQALDLFENQQESILDLFENWWESSRITENHQELVRITKNHWESARINENQGLDLFGNQFQTYSRIIENWWESLRINFRLIQELTWIIKNQFHTYLRISENQWESSRIGKNHQESMRIIENHIKNKVLPYGKMVQGQMTQIYENQCIYSDSHWFALIHINSVNHSHFPIQSNPLNRPHSFPYRQQSMFTLESMLSQSPTQCVRF